MQDLSLLVFNHGFKFQYLVCNGCHYLSILCLNTSNIAIITVKMLIIFVLRITLENLKQLIYWKILCLKIVGICKKNFQFFLLFMFSIYKMVDIMNFYKSLNISIGKMKNPEMLKFLPDRHKTKKDM